MRAETGYSITQLHTMAALDPGQAMQVVAAAQAIPGERRDLIKAQTVVPHWLATAVPFRQQQPRK